jgi:hypothetical protein
MSCVIEVSDEGLCYTVLIIIIMLVNHTSHPAMKVADRKRRKHFRSVVYEYHVSGLRNRSIYHIENTGRFIMFFFDN